MNQEEYIFRYHPEVMSRYPELRAGVILASGVANQPTPPDLRQEFLSEQQAVLARIGETPLSEIETLAAWRAAFRDFGVNPTKYRSAAEALLRRLTKKGDIPCINVLVDICNLVSIRYALPSAAMDTHAMSTGVTVCFADGSESFTPLGESQVENPEPGEVIFKDESDLVSARRWCWRQSDESAASLDTRQAIVMVEAQHAGSSAMIQSARDDLLDLLQRYAGGGFTSALLGPGQPAMMGQIH
jgi:DNA/RNA-binding domain of Phe-tRNA-synthetase-like protein